MAKINVAGSIINLASAKPSGRHLKIQGSGATYYGILSNSKPSYKTLNIRKNNENYYLIKAGKLATSIVIHWKFNNGDGTSSRARIKEIYVYDVSGNDITKQFSFRDRKDSNSKADISGSWKNLIDRNENTEVLGYCTKANDGQANYTVWLESKDGIYIKSLKVIFGHYSDSSDHDGHETYIDFNGERLWTTHHEEGYLEYNKTWEI